MSFFKMKPWDIATSPELEHFGLVVHIATRIYKTSSMVPKWKSLDDLIIVGYFGLKHAWNLYDDTVIGRNGEPTTFSKYAAKVIADFIKKDLNGSEFTIPRRLRVAVAKAMAGRPQSKDIQDRIKINPGEQACIDQALKCSKMTRVDYSDVKYSVNFDQFENQDKLNQALKLLDLHKDNRLGKVIRKIFGIDTGIPVKLRVLAKEMNCTKQNVSVMKFRALNFIKKKMGL